MTESLLAELVMLMFNNLKQIFYLGTFSMHLSFNNNDLKTNLTCANFLVNYLITAYSATKATLFKFS